MQKLFIDGILDGAWGKLTAAERGRILLEMAGLIGGRIDELAAVEARDTGKPMAHARDDIQVTARYFERPRPAAADA